VPLGLRSGLSKRASDQPHALFLGGASFPLASLLTKPQGIQVWLLLKSKRGEAVGALQLAVTITQLDGKGIHSSQVHCVSAYTGNVIRRYIV
jgi:hypothetical protein